MSVPDELIGTVFGKGGYSLREIKLASQADITVSNRYVVVPSPSPMLPPRISGGFALANSPPPPAASLSLCVSLFFHLYRGEFEQGTMNRRVTITGYKAQARAAMMLIHEKTVTASYMRTQHSQPLYVWRRPGPPPGVAVGPQGTHFHSAPCWPCHYYSAHGLLPPRAPHDPNDDAASASRGDDTVPCGAETGRAKGGAPQGAACGSTCEDVPAAVAALSVSEELPPGPEVFSAVSFHPS